MGSKSRFETLTTRHVAIRVKTQSLIADLRNLVQLIEANIADQEDRTGRFDPTSGNYPAPARQLRNRRDNLIATISRLKKQPMLIDANLARGSLRRRRR
jgi:hypothetical protein